MMQDIWNNLKMRTYKKRALTSWVWALGPLGVGIKLYSLLSKASKARAVMTDLSNRPLRSTGAYICQDTGNAPASTSPPSSPSQPAPLFSFACSPFPSSIGDLAV